MNFPNQQLLRPNAKLPHYNIRNRPVHVTYRLAGSVPKDYENILLQRKRKRLEKAFAESLLIEGEYERKNWLREEKRLINVHHQLALEKYLHEESNGPYFLANPEIAELVKNSWRFLHDKSYIQLYAVCIMSNHVHVIFGCPADKAKVDISKVMWRTKSFTATAANKLLRRSGKSFWADQYYDTTIRDGKFLTAMWYLLNNPYQAGLCNGWQEWPHTWLNPDYRLLFTE